MGLDVSHNCWEGAYSAFMRWREELARLAGMPPLQMMEGFTPRFAAPETPIISWEALRPDPALHALLNHSDCDGELPAEICAPLADRLEELLAAAPADLNLGGHIGNFHDKTRQFITGLRDAAAAGEAVEFY